MNILLITHLGDIAGSTNSISYLARGLAEKGHNVYVGCRKESLLFQLLSGSKAHLLPMTFSGRFDLKNIKQVRDAVRKYDIQLINAQSGYDRYSTVFAKWLFGLNVKLVHTRRQLSKSMGGFFQNLVYVKGTDKIVAVSESVKISLARGGIPNYHICVIFNGTPREKYENVDERLTERLKTKFKIKPGDIVVGCISRLKNQEQILRSLRVVKQKVKVIFVGIDQQPGWEDVIQSFQVDHEVYFTGLVPSEKVLSYYGLFDIKILASTIEGLSQSLLESMVLGVPVIATNAGGNPELIEDGVNGYLFEDGDISKLAALIDKLARDKSLRANIAVEGKKTAKEKFSIENTILGYEKLFEELINS